MSCTRRPGSVQLSDRQPCDSVVAEDNLTGDLVPGPDVPGAQRSADCGNGALLVVYAGKRDCLHLGGCSAEWAAFERSGGEIPDTGAISVGGDKNSVVSSIRDRNAVDLLVRVADVVQADDELRGQRRLLRRP
jgi:hypothetical protein